MIDSPENSELGKKSAYDPRYNPEKLFAIPRQSKREELGIDSHNLPFYGADLWHHYEVSWLNTKGKPVVAMATISYSCESPFLIESKSMKLYFNTFNNSKFDSLETVRKLIINDISEKIASSVTVELYELQSLPSEMHIYRDIGGICLDTLDIECTIYETNSSLLTVKEEFAEEVLHSNLLKSNCLVTHQPDWGTVQIFYKGKKIDHEGLLKYIVSFRDHNEFHEQCIERIFIDIMRTCQPEELTVYGRYTRRGGLDINPIRSTLKNALPENRRLCRQ